MIIIVLISLGISKIFSPIYSSPLVYYSVFLHSFPTLLLLLFLVSVVTRLICYLNGVLNAFPD